MENSSPALAPVVSPSQSYDSSIKTFQAATDRATLGISPPPTSSEKPDGVTRAIQVAAVMVPLTVAVLGGSFAATSVWLQSRSAAAVARQTNDARLLDLAVGILRDQPKTESVDIRLWAADLIDKASPVPLPASVRGQLSKTVLPGRVVLFPVGAISVAPDEIKRGEPTLLNWHSANATTVTISPGVGEVAASGTKQVFPVETTTYTLSLSSPEGGLTVVHVSVTVR